MKVSVVYKPESDHARTVTDWIRDFARQTGKTVEEINPESLHGESFVRAYDIVEYPTLIAIDHEGVVHNIWRGTMLPTISEVSFYVQDN